MSALAFAYASLISWSYFGEQPRVWRLVRQGFAYWGRMVRLGLCNILFALPVVAPTVIIGTVATLRSGSQPEWLGWVNLALYPFTAVLGTYSIFTLLNAHVADHHSCQPLFRLLRGCNLASLHPST